MLRIPTIIAIITNPQSNTSVIGEIEKFLQKFQISNVRTILLDQEQTPADIQTTVAEREAAGCKIFIVVTENAIDLAKIVASYATKSRVLALPTGTKKEIATVTKDIMILTAFILKKIL